MRWSRNHCPPVCKVVERCLGVDLPGALCHSLSGDLSQAGVGDRIIDHFMGRQAKEMIPRYQRLLPKESRKTPGRLDFWSVCPLCAKNADGEDSWRATARLG